MRRQRVQCSADGREYQLQGQYPDQRYWPVRVPRLLVGPTRNRAVQPRFTLGTRPDAIPDETGLGTLPRPRRPATKSGRPQFAAVFQDELASSPDRRERPRAALQPPAADRPSGAGRTERKRRQSYFERIMT